MHSQIRRLAVGISCSLALLAVGAAIAQAAMRRNVAVTGREPASYGSPWIAFDPAHSSRLAIGYDDSSNFSACYLALSSNGGRTWHDRRAVGQGAAYPLPSGLDACEYPTVTYAPHNTLYYGFTALKTGSWPPPAFTYVMTSTNGGRSFGRPVKVERGAVASDIMPRLAVDWRSGRLYIAWQSDLTGSSFGAFVASSRNRGKTFSSPTGIGVPGDAAVPFPAIGSDGRVYVGYLAIRAWSASHGRIPLKVMFVSSSNHGRTFGRPAYALGLPSCYTPDNSCQQDQQGQYVYNPGFEVAAGRSRGQVLIVGDYLSRYIHGQQIFRLTVASSFDGGRHWRRRRPVGVPAGAKRASQLGNPTVSVAPDGRIDIAYYNLLEPVGLENTFLISSCDAGKRFSAPLRISSRASNVAVQSSFGFADEPFSVGHLIAATNGASLVAWTDSRRGNRSNAKNDVYFASTGRRCR